MLEAVLLPSNFTGLPSLLLRPPNPEAPETAPIPKIPQPQSVPIPFILSIHENTKPLTPNTLTTMPERPFYQ